MSELTLNERMKQEREALEARHRSLRNQEDERLRKARLKALDDARQEKIDRARAEAEAALKERLRFDFLQANPAATEADFARIYPIIRDEHMAREAREAPEREKAALARTGAYGM